MNFDSPALRWLLTLCLVSALGFAVCVQAAPKLPFLPGGPAVSATGPAAPPDLPVEAQLGQLRQKLSEANEALAQAAARDAQPVSADVASQGELAEAGLLRLQLIRIYQRQIDSLLKLQSLREKRQRLALEAAGWTGFATPPPYSFLVVDELREAVVSQKAHIEALAQMQTYIDQERLRREDYLKESDEKLRQANERLESKADASPRLVWLRDFEALRNRMAEGRVQGIAVERQLNDEELSETRQRLDFTGRQLSEATGKLAFPDADKEQMRKSLAAERGQLQAELEAAVPVFEATRKASDEAAEALKRGREATLAQGGDLAALTGLENQAELQRERMENADLKFQLLNRLLDAVKARRNIWELRWSQAASRDAQEVVVAYGRITKMREELQPMKDYAAQHLALVEGQLADIEKQALDPDSTALASHRQQLRALYGEREATYRRMLRGLDTNLELLDRWKQDLEDTSQAEPWRDRAREWQAQFRAAAAGLWQFELFAVEDTIEVEGQPVTGKRSVTLGKVLTALLILVVGLWLSAKLSGLIERAVVRRGKLDQGSARIAKRWAMFLVGLVLVATSLVMVKIPLTVFAFTGGALAIGTGFGMQNLLKNLISGLMLLLERPFRPGDLVEVSGIRGRVVDIGVRSSHIRDANGIETLIPNSTFVEENVTNWTLSSRSVRISVKLGVAYGSPTPIVAELLREAANRHGLVQKEPAPQVLFEDFGADALQFALHVWVELKPGVDWSEVASDLRHMVNKTLAANGIVMAFPQRDVHLDSAQPLQVRVLKEPVI